MRLSSTTIYVLCRTETFSSLVDFLLHSHRFISCCGSNECLEKYWHLRNPVSSRQSCIPETRPDYIFRLVPGGACFTCDLPLTLPIPRTPSLPHHGRWENKMKLLIVDCIEERGIRSYLFALSIPSLMKSHE